MVMMNEHFSKDETSPFWRQFPRQHRAREMAILADWIAAGESGSVVGLAGMGRANLLGFLCQRPDALALYLGGVAQKVQLISVDLNNLPGDDLATLYRVILRSFYEERERFDKVVQPLIVSVFQRYEAAQDPFLPQSGLRELLLYFQAQGTRIVLVMNRFDRFCESATWQMTNTLRGLRDGFKKTLSYLMGMRQDVVYLSGLESVGPLRGLLDTHVCWVRPLSEVDGRFMIQHQLQDMTVPEEDVVQLLTLTGGYPSLLRVACNWYRTAQTFEVVRSSASPETSEVSWLDLLLAQPNTQHRLREWWVGLSQEEQATLADVHALQVKTRVRQQSYRGLAMQHEVALKALVDKGVCSYEGGRWRIEGALVLAFVGQQSGRSKGRLWWDEGTDAVYQGQLLVGDLAPQEQALLRFLLQFPSKRHTHDDLIEGAWPEDEQRDGVSTEALYQAIRSTRKKIEPNPSQPRYLVTWRGQREGGYQLFPEGRPG